MFRFPFTNFHELNLDWILSVVKEAKEVFDNGRADITRALETANEALETAEQAASGAIGDGAVTIPKINDNVYNLYTHVISGSVSDNNISKGEVILVKNSTIAGINDGVYIAHYDISASSIVTSEDLDTSYKLSNAGSINYTLDKINESGTINNHIKLRSVFNSILTGSVWINGTWSHLTDYDDSPYGIIASKLNVVKNNAVHTLISGGGLVYDSGNGNFYDYIVTSHLNLSGFDYLATMLWYPDMNTLGIGTPSDTASSNTLAGKVLGIVDYLKTNYPDTKLILIGIPPSNPNISGANVFTGNYPNGYNIKQCNALMHTLAETYKFAFVDFESWFVSSIYHNFTDGNNVHFNNDKTYRVLGEYVAASLDGQFSFNSDFNKNIVLTSQNMSGLTTGWRKIFNPDNPLIDASMTVVNISASSLSQVKDTNLKWRVVNGNVEIDTNISDDGTTFTVTLARTNKYNNSGLLYIPRFNTQSIITDRVIGTTGVETVNTYNSRKISDYTLLTFIIGDDSLNHRGVVTIPSAFFSQANEKVYVYAHSGSNLENDSGITIQYNSDTSVYVALTGQKLLTHFMLLGTRLT